MFAVCDPGTAFGEFMDVASVCGQMLCVRHIMLDANQANGDRPVHRTHTD